MSTPSNASSPSHVAQIESDCSKSWTTSAGQSRMVWRRWGNGPALILLHGGAGSWQHWIRNIGHLSKGHTLWIPDMPGFGDSDLPRDGLDADTLAPMVLKGALEVLQGRDFQLIGFSFGALVAGYMAAADPATLRSLVLVSAAGMGMMGDFSSLKPLRKIEDRAERDEVLRHNLQLIMLSRAECIDDLAIAIQGDVAPKDRVRNRKRAHEDILASIAATWSRPAYGIWGDEDPIYQGRIDRLEAKVSQLGLRSHTVLPRAGHWLQYQDADAFHSTLHEYLHDGMK